MDQTRVLSAARRGPAGLRPGDRLADRYELVEEVGRGGMGRVFRAHDPVLGRDVAVKVVTLAASADEDFRQACAREAKAAARLTHHGIVTVFDVGEHDGQSFLVMELVSGRPLRELLDDGGTLPAGRTVEIAEQIADALAYAHRHSVFHCDVKPHNILVTPEGTAKLVDFGIACAATATGAIDTDEIYGSAPYIAPEQLQGDPIDARVDVYALGSVIYEMLVGRPPFEGRNVSEIVARRLTTDPAPPRTLDPSISPELERVVLTALARHPSERYPDGDALRDALRGITLGARAETIRIDAAELRRPSPGPVADASIPDGGTGVPTGGAGISGGVGASARRSGRIAGEDARTTGPLGPTHVDRAAGAAARISSSAKRLARRLPPRLLFAVAGLAALLAAGLLFAALRPSPSAPSDGLPGVGWAQLTKRSCEWSNLTTPPGICFGEREPGFRVRVMEPSGQRWLIWDPETRNVAYVDPDAIRRE